MKTVLVVDDAPEIIAVLSSLFEVEGFCVVAAQSAQEGLAKYRAGRAGGKAFDLISVDIRMPEIDGTAFVKMVRDEGFKGPVVAFTANPSVAGKKSGATAGIDAYFSKTVLSRDLIQAIKTQFCNG